jgi:hypothetical protein
MTGPSRSIEAALDLIARYALPVFPCGAHKKPTSKHGFKDATRDRDEAIALWRKHPGPLIGVPTGAVSGFDVLDVDPRHGGDAWLEDNRCRLPITRMHRTRSGGLHFLFAHARGVRNSESKIAAGIDVRGDGGYVIWWPATGLVVEYADDAADWPAWLLGAVGREPRKPWTPTVAEGGKTEDRYIAAALRRACERVATAPDGARNSTLNAEAFSIGRFVAGGALGAQEVADELARAAAAAGLGEREIARTLASALGARGIS